MREQLSLGIDQLKTKEYTSSGYTIYTTPLHTDCVFLCWLILSMVRAQMGLCAGQPVPGLMLWTEKDNYVHSYFIYFRFALLVMAQHLVWLSLILQCRIRGQNSDEPCRAIMYYLSIVEPQVSQKAQSAGDKSASGDSLQSLHFHQLPCLWNSQCI